MTIKKTGVVASLVIMLLMQFSIKCFGQVIRDVPIAAASLRNLIREKPFTEIEQFLQRYLDEEPYLLPEIFWNKGYFVGDDLPLYDIVHRRTEFNDHDRILDLLVETLKEAYQKKGHSSADAIKMSVEWLLENNTGKSRFLEYCIFSSAPTRGQFFHRQRCSKENRRKIVAMVIKILNKYSKAEILFQVLSSENKNGFSLNEHIEDL